jgi:hypothetical protein
MDLAEVYEFYILSPCNRQFALLLTFLWVKGAWVEG